MSEYTDIVGLHGTPTGHCRWYILFFSWLVERPQSEGVKPDGELPPDGVEVHLLQASESKGMYKPHAPWTPGTPIPPPASPLHWFVDPWHMVVMIHGKPYAQKPECYLNHLCSINSSWKLLQHTTPTFSSLHVSLDICTHICYFESHVIPTFNTLHPLAMYLSAGPCYCLLFWIFHPE